ncbi:unnamed protein product [Rhizoctonia solani]|uniref:Uncharacterized protein n=1 Tax=Rhizoctonia solani TaxID=456999 RepID=A0A8H3D498_9AGAM|nr:unnamed protein product [Rhizoctonia solani]
MSVTYSRDKYGIKLKVYLLERDLPQIPHQTRVASDVQIREAFNRFRIQDPPDITFETLEIILSMEKNPHCRQLTLLISETMREKGTKLLAYSYGYLSLHVITLAIQVVKVLLAQRMGFMLDETERLSPNDSIRPVLSHHVRAAEDQLLLPNTSIWYLPWGLVPELGHKACLTLIGGFTLPDALFLVEQLWISRKEFLYAAAWGARDFLGWSGLLHMLWSIIIQAEEAEPSSGRETVQRRHWVALGDIIFRYALCELDEDEDTRISQIVEDKNFLSVLAQIDSSTAVDTADLNMMIVAYSKKIKSTPTKYLHNYMSTLLTYALPNANRGYDDFAPQLSRFLRPFFDRIWDEFLPLKASSSKRRWSSMVRCQSDAVMLLVSTSGAYPSQDVGNTILSTVMSEEFYELLGRLILYPMLQDGQKLLGNSVREDNAEATLRDRDMMVRSYELVEELRETLPFGVNGDAFLIWNRSGAARDVELNNIAAGDVRRRTGYSR